MFKKMLKNEKGLTLIELLAVIVILGIIAAIAVPSIGGIIQKSREDAVKADALQILNAAKIYVSSNGVDTTDITDEMLAEYVTDVDGFGTAGDGTVDYTVKTDVDSKTFTLTTKEVKAGKRTIQFTGASVANIKANTPAADSSGKIVIDKDTN